MDELILIVYVMLGNVSRQDGCAGERVGGGKGVDTRARRGGE